MKLMLIDDDYSIMESIRSVMHQFGHECEIFQNPHNALEVYRKKQFDVVVTDYKLPEMNGIEILKEIRVYDRNARVILMTGYPNLVNTISALKNGVYAFMRKPIKFKTFIDILSRIEGEKSIKNETEEINRQDCF